MTQPPEQQPVPSGSTPTPVEQAQPAQRPWVARHKIATVLLVLLGLSIVGSVFGQDEPDATSKVATSSPTSTTSAAPVVTTAETPSAEAPATEAPTTEVAAPVTTKAAPKPKPTKELTSGQSNALRSAENYLSFAPFSRRGLIRQLSSSAGDGFPVKDATYAADHIKVNWNEQAAKAAKNYLEISPFSRKGMIRQLESSAGDSYSHEQAVYGAKKAGL